MSAADIIPSDPARVLHLMDQFRDVVTFDEPNVPYVGSAGQLAQLIVDAKDRLTGPEKAMLIGVGAVLLRQLAISTGMDRLSEMLGYDRVNGGAK